MKLTNLRLLPLLLLLHSAGSAQAVVPTLINYQGYVTDAGGTPVGSSGPVERTVEFRFWNHATSNATGTTGNLLYAETQTVTINGGNFSVLIGNAAPTGEVTRPPGTLASAFDSATVFLGITVDDGTAAADPEIAPRQQIVTTAFAFRAKIAEGVDSGAITNTMLAGGIAGSKITNDSLTSAQLGSNSVTSGEIATDAVRADEIQANAVGSSEIATDAVGADEIQANAVGSSEIATNAVGSSEIATNAVGADEIQANAVGSSEIAANAVRSDKISDRSITSSDIAFNTITTNEIAPGGVGDSEIAAGAVTSSKLGVGTVMAGTTTESMKIISGVINWDGTKLVGNGFTSQENSTHTGFYQISFDTAFSSEPVIMVTPEGTLSGANVWQGNSNIPALNGTEKKSKVWIRTFNAGNGTSTRDKFHFIAIGPR